MSQPVTLEIHDHIATLLLNDPQRLNAMSPAMAEAFAAAVAVVRSKAEVRAVVIGGAGKAFSAGGDLDFLEERSRTSPEENARQMRWFYRQFLSLRTIMKPVVAGINGHAIGAGLSMTLACDARICAEEAKLGFTFSQLGMHPGMGTTFYLPKRAGMSRASRLMTSGAIFTAPEALTWGLVDEILPAEAVLSQARVVAAEMMEGGPMAVRLMLETLRGQEDQGLEEALEREAWCQAANYASKEFLTGLEAVKTKTKAVFY